MFPCADCEPNEQILRIAADKIKSHVWARSRRYALSRSVMSELRITDVAVDVVRWPLKMKRRHGVGDIEEFDSRRHFEDWHQYRRGRMG